MQQKHKYLNSTKKTPRNAQLEIQLNFSPFCVLLMVFRSCLN